MYKKVTSNYVVMEKFYQQTRGKNLTFFVEKPCICQQNGKHTSLRGNLAKPVVARVLSVSVKKTLPDYVVIQKSSNIKALGL